MAGRRPVRRAALVYDPRARGLFFQILVALALILFFVWIADNAVENLRRAKIASGFDFFGARAGFGISQTLIPYSSDSTYARAFLVGFFNTLLVAAVGVVVASMVGFLAGIARLSRNWLIAGIATVYVETLRNIPLLVQLLFWYKAVLSILPGPKDAIGLPFDSVLSNRGLILPAPQPQAGFAWTLIALLVAVAIAVAVGGWSRRRQRLTGRRFPAFAVGAAVVILLPVAVFLLSGAPLAFGYADLQGFNFVGGFPIQPEFLALLLGLVLYTGTFIAEIVRAGVLAVPQGQTEAAHALGLRAGVTLRRVVMPQALRVIIPPLTNQYLNLTKNSSLAVAVGYPEIVSVFSGTVLSQTGQAVEVIFITMLVYLALSLATSAFMNWFDRRVALVER